MEENNEVRIDNDPDKINISKIKNNVKKNPWKISTIVFGVIALILLVMILNGGITGNVIIVSEDEAAQNVLDFANTQGAQASLIEVNEDGDFYEVVLLMQGQEIPVHVTRDGEFLIQGLIPLTAPIDAPSQAQQQPTDSIQQIPEQTSDYSEEDLNKIKEFTVCLLEANTNVYGAGWCPYCQDLIKYFGGKDIIEPIYIECSDKDRNPTENAELCSQENINGFPTIKIKGDVYEGPRTFEGLSEATGCLVPGI